MGQGCAGTAGIPLLQYVGSTTPRIGTTFQLEVLNLGPSAVVSLAFGDSKSAWSDSPLPLDLS